MEVGWRAGPLCPWNQNDNTKWMIPLHGLLGREASEVLRSSEPHYMLAFALECSASGYFNCWRFQTGWITQKTKQKLSWKHPFWWLEFIVPERAMEVIKEESLITLNRKSWKLHQWTKWKDVSTAELVAETNHGQIRLCKFTKEAMHTCYCRQL